MFSTNIPSLQIRRHTVRKAYKTVLTDKTFYSVPGNKSVELLLLILQ